MLMFLIVVSGSVEGRELLHRFGCSRRSNVTVVVYKLEKQRKRIRYHLVSELYRLIVFLEDPCATVFYFHRGLGDVIRLKGGQSLLETDSDSNADDAKNDDDVSFIKNLQEQVSGKDVGVTQILLFAVFGKGFGDNILNALETFDNKLHCNVLLLCVSHACPRNLVIPFNQIEPLNRFAHRFNQNQLATIKHLVRNPDFKKFKFMELVTRDGDERLKCLANKTVLMAFRTLPFDLLVDIVRIVLSTKRFQTNFIIVYSSMDSPKEFSDFYLEKNGLEKLKRLKFKSEVTRMFDHGYNYSAKHLYILESTLLFRHNVQSCNQHYFYETILGKDNIPTERIRMKSPIFNSDIENSLIVLYSPIKGAKHSSCTYTKWPSLMESIC